MRLLLYKGRSLLSRAIQWRTWSEYSHAAIEFEGSVIVDAWKGGVRIIESPHDGHDPETVIEAFRVADLSDEGILRARSFALAQVGKPYDYRGVLRFMSRRDPSRASHVDPARANGRWFCSRLAFRTFAVAGARLLDKQEWRVFPGDLAASERTVRVPL